MRIAFAIIATLAIIALRMTVDDVAPWESSARYEAYEPQSPTFPRLP